MELKVKNLKTGVIYSSDRSNDNKHSILSINFQTDYTQVNVQDEIILESGQKTHPNFNIIMPIGGKMNWVTLIAGQEDMHGEWVL
jgi:hypothetical protein